MFEVTNLMTVRKSSPFGEDLGEEVYVDSDGITNKLSLRRTLVQLRIPLNQKTLCQSKII